MDAFPDEKGIYRLGNHKEELYSEIYRNTCSRFAHFQGGW
jgi:hypothetical protein